MTSNIVKVIYNPECHTAISNDGYDMEKFETQIYMGYESQIPTSI